VKKKIETDIFIDNLPTFLDSISTSNDGSFWLAGVQKRSYLLDIMHPFPFMKKLFLSLPLFLHPKNQMEGYVFHLDVNGNVLDYFEDKSGKLFDTVTSVNQYEDFILLGNLHHNNFKKVYLKLDYKEAKNVQAGRTLF